MQKEMQTKITRILTELNARSYFPLQKIKQDLPDGRLIISCRASNTEEIIHTIFHWLPEIKVRAPKELAKEVKKQIQSYLKDI